MKTRPVEYDALTFAALDARDALRNIIPQLDAALSGKSDPHEVLKHTRDLVAIHSTRLHLRIKRPAYGLKKRQESGTGSCWETE